MVCSHHALFAKLLKGTRLSYEEIDRRYYGPDTAVVTTRGDTIKGKAKPLTKVQTYTLVRREDGDWQGRGLSQHCTPIDQGADVLPLGA